MLQEKKKKKRNTSKAKKTCDKAIIFKKISVPAKEF